MSRPPEIVIDEKEIRSDIFSKSVEDTYPDLPIVKNDWKRHRENVKLRLDYIKNNDKRAYEKIKNKYPNFTPPGYYNY